MMLQEGADRLIAQYGVDAVLLALASHFDKLDADSDTLRPIYKLHAITLRAANKRVSDDMRIVFK